MNTPVASLGTGPTQDALIELAGFFAASRHVEAEAAARRMTETWPEYGIAWKALGAVLAVQARLDEAMTALQKAVELLPADPETHNTFGNVLQRLGRFSESEASYRRAIELRPGYFEAYNNLGAELHALGRVSEAEASYRRAVELKSDYHEAHNNLGNALQALGRPAEAEARREAERRVAQLGLRERVQILPAVRSTEVPATMATLDALALPSRTTPSWKEQFGRVLIEAMSCGVPVIGSSSGEIPHVIGGDGLTFPEGDVAALRERIARLVAEPELRTELARRGRERVLTAYTQAAVARRHVEVYRAMVSN